MLTLMTLSMRVLYGSCFINFNQMTKVYMIVTVQVIAFVLISISCFNTSHISYFYLALVASGLTGATQGMGEATFLGFCKVFPSHVVGYVSSGTGMAGISGTLLILILN